MFLPCVRSKINALGFRRFQRSSCLERSVSSISVVVGVKRVCEYEQMDCGDCDQSWHVHYFGFYLFISASDPRVKRRSWIDGNSGLLKPPGRKTHRVAVTRHELQQIVFMILSSIVLYWLVFWTLLGLWRMVQGPKSVRALHSRDYPTSVQNVRH